MSSATDRSRRFLEELGRRLIIGDGAMGTLLYSRGVRLDTNFECLNLRAPELIRQVHEEYLAAGSRLLETNTFGANAPRLAGFGLEGQARAINLSGARLAREAADDAYVAGSVGPLQRPRGEGGVLSREEAEAALREQMEALAEGGVDLFLLETFADLADLELGVAIARELGLPVVAQMAFLQEGRTRDGISAEQAALRLTEAGATMIGANCGAGPGELLRVVSRMASVSALPLSAFPNSGFPEYVEGRYIYLATPEYFAGMGRELARAGAVLLGGCCGTTPEHIRALTEALADLVPAPTARVVLTPDLSPPVVTPPPESRPDFLADWGARPIVTVELDPPRGLNCAKVLDGARALARAGVDAISLAENPLGRIRLGNVALARSIQEETGTEVIVHVTCRDRNLIGLHSELMGAHLLGIRNILAVTGDPVAVGAESGATNVFDLNSVSLLELLSALNDGQNLLGAELDGRTRFLLGAAFNPNLATMDGQLRKLGKKVAAGARFVQTQPVYSTRVLDELLEKTAPFRIPVLVGILPLVSERNAEFLHNEVPGITLPEAVRERMRGKQGEAGVREGMAIARELIEAGRGRCGGYYLMPPFGKVELALELMEFIRRTAG